MHGTIGMPLEPLFRARARTRARARKKLIDTYILLIYILLPYVCQVRAFQPPFPVSSSRGNPMSVRHAILGLLHYQDMHGYRIKRHMEEHFGHMWSINYGQIYPNLKKMEEEGLLTKQEVARSGPPPGNSTPLPRPARKPLPSGSFPTRMERCCCGTPSSCDSSSSVSGTKIEPWGSWTNRYDPTRPSWRRGAKTCAGGRGKGSM